nr:immunoglobulin light chain junction region [Macaca mulatta]MOW11184.1 immunoglobulin light chain junction region [Macaca mulatta]MOW13104.1 immunoglobulin light chain junction region [Macaca mulatta]
CQQYFKWWTF